MSRCLSKQEYVPIRSCYKYNQDYYTVGKTIYLWKARGSHQVTNYAVTAKLVTCMCYSGGF